MAYGATIKTLEQYKKLTSEEKDFYHFEQLKKIDMVHDTMLTIHKEMDSKYAAKRVEYLVYIFVGMILLAFFGSVISGVIPVK